MIVVDASVVAAALGDDGEDGKKARSRLTRDADLHAPHLIDLEVMSTWRRLSFAGDMSSARVAHALTDLSDLPITRYGHLAFVARCWELHENATPYDASYIALAEALDCTFVTGDRRLATVPGVMCSVEVVE